MSLIYDGLALAQEQDKSHHGAGMYVLYEPFPKGQDKSRHGAGMCVRYDHSQRNSHGVTSNVTKMKSEAQVRRQKSLHALAIFAHHSLTFDLMTSHDLAH